MNLNYDELLRKTVEEIRTNHNKIVDDWCKAYMSELYQKHGSIKPSNFMLCEQQEFEERNGKLVKVYWFEPNVKKIID